MMSSSSSDSGRGFCLKASGKEHYFVYRARLEAKLKAKNLWVFCDPDTGGKFKSTTQIQKSADGSQELIIASGSQFTEKSSRMKDKATQIILSSLGDVPFRVVESEIGNPSTMIYHLDERYASNTAATRISILTSLYRTIFVSGSLEKHCDGISSLLSQAERMGVDFAVPDLHKGPLLLESIGFESPYEATAAALRTKKPDELTFELVSSTLIEEARSQDSFRFEKNKKNGKARDNNREKHGQSFGKD